MANVCSDAGPLGRSIRHPGPQVGWHTRDGILLPLWASQVLPLADLTPAYWPTDEEFARAAAYLDAAVRR